MSENDKIKETIEILNEKRLPLIPLRGMTIYPHSIFSLDIGREKSIKALEYANSNNINLVFVAQKDFQKEDVLLDDLYNIGVTAAVKQIFKIPGGITRVIVQGLLRCEILSHNEDSGFFMVEVADIDDEDSTVEDNNEVVAVMKTAKTSITEYANLTSSISSEVLTEILTCEKPGMLSDLISANLLVKLEDKQTLIEIVEPLKRLTFLLAVLCKELSIVSIQKDIYLKVKNAFDKKQRDYFLEEQIKTMKEELGYEKPAESDIDSYRDRLSNAKYPDETKKRLEKEILRLEKMSVTSAEASLSRDYIELLLDLPWTKKSLENKNLKKAETILNAEHYGLEKVKERIIEFLAVKQNAPESYSPILCLVGPPGVGKTSVVKSVAKALNKKYMRISLGGVRDEAEIRGHRKTYIGSMPGRIINSIKQVGISNPLILLDEIDKMTSDFKGDPGSALLEVLDSEQNSNFRDHYLEIPYNLSDVFFICTANTTDTIPYALRDRLEIINLSAYTEYEKFEIGKNFLLKKQLKRHGIRKNSLKIADNVLRNIIKFYTREAGVRQLERKIEEICRKTVKFMLTDETKKTYIVDTENLETFLGKKLFKEDKKNVKPEVGIARGLAWTSVGGDTLSVEVNTMKGDGKFKFTGNVGSVMKESASVAVSYIRSVQKELNIPKNFYKNRDIHIHIPEGAVPKDGPSAGITMAAAMISALTETPINNSVAMTGEITIRGKVLPIGGLKEKIIAAKNAGLSKIILPYENESDLNEIPLNIKENLEFVLVESMEEVLRNSLEL